MCEKNAVSVCSGVQEYTRVLQTQLINKSLPVSDEYPVRVFVNVSYSVIGCPLDVACNNDLELQLVEINNASGSISTEDIVPQSHIRDLYGTETQFYFDLKQHDNDQFKLVLVHHPMSACITVSRVLVYRYECPGISLGLVRLPATHSPVGGTMSVSPHCTMNSHHTEESNPESLVCSSEGIWFNDQTVCICNQGYYRDSDDCKGIIEHVFYSA